MAKKRKFRDPMKYKTEEVMHGGIIVKQTRKERRTKRMADVLQKIEAQGHLLDHDLKVLRTKFNLQDYVPDFREPDSEQVLQFKTECAEIVANHDVILSRLGAEYTAMFLIANNIARRGKLLHPDTAIKKLYKMQHNGSIYAYFAESHIINSTTPLLSYSAVAKPNLHYYLHKYYGITLMDYTMYQYCMDQINLHKQRGKYGTKDLQHYENLVKKFHAAVINNKIQQLDDRPF